MQQILSKDIIYVHMYMICNTGVSTYIECSYGIYMLMFAQINKNLVISILLDLSLKSV